MSFVAAKPLHVLRPGTVPDLPLAYQDKRLVWNGQRGVRERTAPCDEPKGRLGMN